MRCMPRIKSLAHAVLKVEEKKHTFLKLLEFVNTQRGLENEFVAPNETPSASVISTEVMLTSCCARRSAAGRADESDPR